MNLFELLFFNRYVLILDEFLMKHRRIGMIVCFCMLWILITLIVLALFHNTAAVESGTYYNKFGV